jgi:hypothetical protein
VPLIAILLSGADARADEPARAPSRAAAVDVGAAAIRLDGELNDQAWDAAPPIVDFVQRDPDEGAAPTFRTEARIAYDDSHLYIAVRAFDPEPAKIRGLLTRRDMHSPSDWIRVLIDSYHDRRTAYDFGVNAAGVKLDRYWFNDTNEDSGWDAVWDVEVRHDPQGWRAEFRIPFSQLRFDPGRTGVFGFAVMRQVARLNETSSWPLLSKAASGFVSSFGELAGVTGARAVRRLELVPYVVGEIETDSRDPANPLVDEVDPGASLGLDLKFSLTPALTLSGTVNPDFGQVEADPAVVNLTAFETFFAERRPFFVEGSGIFRFDINCNDGSCTGLFYSRRIGRAPQNGADAPDGGYALAPAQTTILGAGKISGRAGRFSIGALNAVTAEERAVIAAGPVRTSQIVEPTTSYSVVRAKRDFADQSSIGFMLTATNRALADAVRDLPAQAYSGGVDWDWRLGRHYAISGYWASSRVLGDAAAIDRLQRNGVHAFQRPDADHLDYDPARTSLDGQALQVVLGKVGGQRLRFTSVAGLKTPGFDINDLGFLRRADERFMSNWVQFRDDEPSRLVRSLRLNLNQWAGWNGGGDLLYGGGNVNAHAVFTSNWAAGGGFNVEQGGFDDRLTRGGPGGLRNDGWNLWGYVDSDQRRPVIASTFLSYWSDRTGSRSWSVEPYATLRPSPALSISGGMGFRRNVNDYQWIENVEDPAARYVFGHLDQTTVSLTTRVNYTLAPTVSIQLYAAPFVSSGVYTGFKELVDGRAPRYADRFAPYGYAGAPDFNYRSFRTTNVFRWEYRPGSTLFVVWQQGREESLALADFRLGRDVRGAFGAPAQNVFLVKLAYWLNY